MDSTWAPVPESSDFPLANLPYGVARFADGDLAVVTRIGDHVLRVADAVNGSARTLVEGSTLDPLLAAGPASWRIVRDDLVHHLTDPAAERPLTPVDTVRMLLPMSVGDYVDFYSSIDHATTVGRLFRPDAEPLLQNWRRLPVAYHGRSGSVAVSGTPVTRPTGLLPVGDDVVRGPSAALDFELEVGFVVGPGNPHGAPIEPDDADGHVFGAVLVNDWSARDLQSYEYRPLGPFLGKSFLTTVSPWVVPLEALLAHVVEPPAQDPEPDAFLRSARPWALDVELSASVDDTVVTRTNLRGLYWTFAQQLAHLTSNGAITRPGDLFATGTVSGPAPGEQGCLLEATENGHCPITLTNGTTRTWLEDGDTVTLRGWCGEGTERIGFGTAVGTVLPATGPGGRP